MYHEAENLTRDRVGRIPSAPGNQTLRVPIDKECLASEGPPPPVRFLSLFVAPFRTPVIMAALCNERVNYCSSPVLRFTLSACVPLAADQSTNAPALATNQTAKADIDSFSREPSLKLLALPPDQLEKVDIARIDLLCAEGLPGAEDLDIEKVHPYAGRMGAVCENRNGQELPSVLCRNIPNTSRTHLGATEWR